MTEQPHSIDGLCPESETQFRQCFIEDPASGRVGFTRKGHAEYAARFAKAGIDIHQIRTRDEFRQACMRSEWVLFQEIRQMVKGHTELEMVLKPLWS